MLEAIGLLAVIFFAIWVIDLIFFKEERSKRIKAVFDKQSEYDEKQTRLMFLESDVVSELNKKLIKTKL